MSGMHIKFGVTPEEFLGHLTEAAYRSALKHGFKASFMDVALDMQEALRQVMSEDILVSESCGSEGCLAFKKESLKVWSESAKSFFKENNT